MGKCQLTSLENMKINNFLFRDFIKKIFFYFKAGSIRHYVKLYFFNKHKPKTREADFYISRGFFQSIDFMKTLSQLYSI